MMPQAGFDVLVVGAGSAGCVVAARLAEDPGCRVALVEAGHWPADPDIADPLAWPRLGGRDYDWAYWTVPQAHTAGRRHPWPRGRLVGGSSAINAMAHIRGHPSDFDAWGHGWSFATLRPYFERSALPVWLPEDEVSPLARAFMAAGRSLGFDDIGHHNGARMDGVAPNSLTIRDGRRVSVADAYLAAPLPNLMLLTGAAVDHVVFEGHRAVGVALADGRTLWADRIVLAAGTVASPLILMRSGIGDPEELAAEGISVRIANPAVGANLHDHLLGAGNLYRAKRPVPPSRLQHSEWLLYAGDPPRLVVACVVAPVVSDMYATPPEGTAYSLLFGITQPQSRGRIALRTGQPVIDPGYLSEEADRTGFRDALALARELGAAQPLDGWRGKELLPFGRDLDRFITRAVITHHHPVGTCSIGTVVDGGLAVIGAEALFVSDGSVIPRITSGPTNAAIVALAERAADLLRGLALA